MGGYVALAFARKYPGRLGGLILAATRAGPDSVEGKAGRDRAAAQAQAEGAAAVSAGMLPKLLAPVTYERRPELVQQVDEMMRTISLEGMVGDLQAMRDRPDSIPTLEKLAKPVLILHGADDKLIPPSEAEGMAAAQPQAHLELLPEAGHLLNLEQPERFNSAILRFLQGNFPR
jgi:pimeloyl-ACP methyl ester carboxylesterase